MAGKGTERERMAKRRREALEMRTRAMTYQQIADALKVSISTAYGDVKAELEKLQEETAEDAREVLRLELDRLDKAAAALASKVEEGDTRAIDSWLRIMDRRARYLGLDSAQRIEAKHDFGVDLDAVRRKIARKIEGEKGEE